MRRVGLVVIAFLLAAGSAQASVVQIAEVDVGDRFDVEIQEELHVDGDRREHNRIVVRALSRGRYEVRDRGARLHALDGCRSRGRHRAVCTPDDSVVFVQIHLGRGDDRLLLRRTSAIARGGGGDDRLTGGGSRDVFYGGPGDDVLRGRGDRDYLRGGTGRDVMAGAGGNDTFNATDGRGRREADRLSGGAGRDAVSWARSGLAVRARMTGRRVRGERDRGTGIEELRGGARNDRLVGGGRNDRLKGGGGDDVLLGRGGADRITPGFTTDRDDVRCGGGEDRIVSPRRFVFVRPDCELVTDGFTSVRPRLRLLGDGRVEAAVACPARLLCYLRVQLVSAPEGVPGGSGKARRLAPALTPPSDAPESSTLVFEPNDFGREYLGDGGVAACVHDGFNGYCVIVR